jgi:hypothetical protein
VSRCTKLGDFGKKLNRQTQGRFPLGSVSDSGTLRFSAVVTLVAESRRPCTGGLFASNRAEYLRSIGSHAGQTAHDGSAQVLTQREYPFHRGSRAQADLHAEPARIPG